MSDQLFCMISSDVADPQSQRGRGQFLELHHNDRAEETLGTDPSGVLSL